MKKIFFIISAASMVFAASCAKEQMPVVENTDNVVLKTFTADLPDADTKTSLVDGRKVHWTEGDKISVFDCLTEVPNDKKDQAYYYNHEFTSSNINGSLADFSSYITEGAEKYIAVYPYKPANQCNGTDLRVEVQNYQQYVQGGFDTNTNIMVAQTTDDHLSFKNILSLVKLTLPEKSDVVSVTLISTKYIAGKFKVTLNADGTFGLSGINSQNTKYEVTLCNGGNPLSGDCYFVVAPHKEHTFTICFTTSEDKRYTYVASNKQEVKANQVIDLGTVPVLKDSEVKIKSHYKVSIVDELTLSGPEGTTYSCNTSDIIKGLDAKTGKVTLGNKPGIEVVKANYGGKVYPIVIEAMPFYRDDENLLSLWGATSGDRKGENFTYELAESNNETYMKVTSVEAKYSCLRRSQKAWFAPGYAPLVAFRVSPPVAVDETETVNSYSFKVDLATYGWSGTNYYGEIGGGNKTWQNVYTCSDGSKIYVYNLAEQKLGCGYPFASDFVGDPNNLTVKYCDFKNASGKETKVTFNFYWFRTYGSWAEFDAHLAEWRTKTGLDAQWGNEYKTE